MPQILAEVEQAGYDELRIGAITCKQKLTIPSIITKQFTHTVKMGVTVTGDFHWIFRECRYRYLPCQ